MQANKKKLIILGTAWKTTGEIPFLCRIYSFLLPDLQYHRGNAKATRHTQQQPKKAENEKMKRVGKLYGREKRRKIKKIKKNCLYRIERSFHRNFIWSGGLCATLFTDMQTMFGSI